MSDMWNYTNIPFIKYIHAMNFVMVDGFFGVEWESGTVNAIENDGEDLTVEGISKEGFDGMEEIEALVYPSV